MEVSLVKFRPEYLDFDRGIRVGKLEDNARISRILKLAVEECFGEPFVTERYGRGMYWQWIGLLSRSNRAAKPISSGASFGCSKFFVMVSTKERLFECGMQVERGYVDAPKERQPWALAEDWDWHRLLRALRKGGPLEKHLDRLVREEGFAVRGGNWGSSTRYSSDDYPGVQGIRKALQKASKTEWAGFQLYYSMTEEEVKSSTGPDLVGAMLAVFDEVTPAMNLCMQTELAGR